MSSRPLPPNAVFSASKGISNRSSEKTPVESPPKELKKKAEPRSRVRQSVDDLIKNSIRVRSQLRDKQTPGSTASLGQCSERNNKDGEANEAKLLANQSASVENIGNYEQSK